MTTLQILSKEEEKTFNQKPAFNSQQQKYYFSIPKSLLEKIESDFNQIYFVLLYGYFKATNKFFTDLNDDKNLAYCLRYFKDFNRYGWYKFNEKYTL